MDVIPFINTWPYEKQINDIYIHTCPYCDEEQVLTHMKTRDLARAKEGFKVILIMPCCNEKMTILEADDDYFWTDQPLRK
ncbi:hypothetical protein [Alkalihalobacillus trypoxylicola]|uniref:Uncharacterized protein n=1 Tax=Alkalihalobacillus trypoxylicola TaxID=519424 RepID=A0A161Q8R7_9BACI|nr:hypothetical protein [Alkalihalobacillus trypoxylicola]KYG33535.1 hypothetical protein AZF04_16370 [Alkalihalobacillus trypoxylicola]GAF64916.1 hypothetical protein BTS2_1812 [Bacillus sp. TS-2]